MNQASTFTVCTVLLLGSMTAAAQQRAATDRPPGDWPAFHGGGPLTGEAPAGALGAGGPAMKERWAYVTNEDDPSPIVASAAIKGDAVYVADADGTLHAVDLKTGKGRWKYEAEIGFETTPLVVGSAKLGFDVVLLGDMGGVFHAVDARSGAKLWTIETLNTIHSSANAFGEHVVFGNDGAEIYCVNASDGSEVWKKTANDRVNSAPAIGWGAALVSGCDGKLRAIDLKTGEEKFAAELGAVSAASPAVVGDRMITGTDQGRVVCLSSDGAKQLWEYDQVQAGAMVYASPAVSEGVAVVGARDRQVHALDAESGKQLWTFRTKGDVDSSPAVAGGRVYVGSKDKRFYVLDLKTGKSLWEFNAGKAIVSSPAIGGGAVIFGDNGGTLHCLEPQ
jgi:outer membrane protein assembly factor BamB